MEDRNPETFTMPWALAAAVFVLMIALLEKGLNLVGGSIPFTHVYPRQLLDWAVVLFIFDIALSMRQLLALQSRK